MASILLMIVGILVLFGVFLRVVVLRYLDRTLANIRDYYGHIEDIDISLHRAAYESNKIHINE